MKARNNLILLITLALFALSSLAALCADKREYYCLKKGYDYYKKAFISSDGRVMDPARGNITVSEGQSYILQRAVVSNDPKTFNLAYNWTKKHLQRRDKLFAWIWGKDTKGKYKVLDINSAADADVNIAFALILAYERWKDEKYLKEAKPIISSIWRNETRNVNRRRVLMPGFVQARAERIEINPSYFHPLAFKSFKKYDTWHNWDKVVESSHYFIMESSSKTKTGLPPNWFLVERGKIILENNEKSDFSYDSIRVFKKYYWDYIETKDARDLDILAKSKFFIKKWKKSKKFYTNYKADGTLRDFNEFIGGIAIIIPSMSIYDKKVVMEIFNSKIDPYLFDKNRLTTRNDYYGKNLLWYGCYLYFRNAGEYNKMDNYIKDILKTK